MNNLDKAIKADVKIFISKSFKKNGIERTEDIINDIYKNLPKLKKMYLEEFNNITRRR